MFDVYPYLRWSDLIDVLLVAGMLWAAFLWVRRTRSRLALLGLLFLSGVYLAARELELQLTVWILQGFFAVLVIVLVVIFQEDLRAAFEQIAVWGLRRWPKTPSFDAVDLLTRVVSRMAQKRTGALIVLPGREPLDRHLEGGIGLDGELSEPLLLSLFDVHSPGHDGAVVISGARVTRFAVHLPLSGNTGKVGGGTRHAAALGLAERSDALCIAVSEERGTVTVARDGEAHLRDDPGELSAELRSFLERVRTGEGSERRRSKAVRPWLEAVAAVAVALLLWVTLVPGSSEVEETWTAAVVVENLPAGYRLESVDPPRVEVTFTCPRRLLPEGPDALEVRIDALLAELGRRTFRVTPAQVEAPPGVLVFDVDPEKVRLSLTRE